MKNFIPKSFLLLLMLGLAVSCKKGTPSSVSESGNKEVAQSKFARNYPDFNPTTLKELLQTKIANDPVLHPYYQIAEYKPAWIHDTLDTKNLNQLISILEDVEMHGLQKKLFPAERIKELTDSVDQGLYTGNPDLLYSKMYELEHLSTNTTFKYILGMRFGFINPKKIHGKKDYDITIAAPDSAYMVELYREVGQDPLAAITASHPADDVYLKMQEEYRLWEKRKELEFKKITASSETFKAGSKSKHISEIAERLMLTGEYMPDSIGTDTLHQILNENLLAAINKFRKRISYPEEPEVGKLTFDALNRSSEYYQKKIRANMERYRWRRTKSIHSKHIEVNVAAAMLAATNKDSLELISRVCVGTVTNKTPLLQSDIAYLNLNPVWNVPKSIAQNEIAVLQKKDPTYIKRKNMKLYKGGKEVDVESIDWSEVNPSKFSYYVRQAPGYGNSLGLIKFMFNNNFSVYLHDTPSKSAFNRKNRAVSHGCVRVQKPFDLAFFCLSPVNDVYKDRLLYSVTKEPVSKEGKKLLKEQKLKKLPDIINLDQDNKISLFIDYYTAFTYPNDDSLYYADDVYSYDDNILNALDSLKVEI
ncbi:MAG: L,D-transpeptidase family protein [Dysgonomonas sp.]|nr:L,D-transpeptidase family protein [Dysgonomonas sp.]